MPCKVSPVRDSRNFSVEFRSFYKPGRVFQVDLVTQKAARQRLGAYTDAISDDKGFYYIVLKTDQYNSYATCVRIFARQERQISMPGSYAIVYTSAWPPWPLRDEQSTKEALRVQVDQSRDTLSPMSRIDFTKPFPVSFDAKVCNFGKIAQTDLNKFLTYGFETQRRLRDESQRPQQISPALIARAKDRRSPAAVVCMSCQTLTTNMQPQCLSCGVQLTGLEQEVAIGVGAGVGGVVLGAMGALAIGAAVIGAAARPP